MRGHVRFHHGAWRITADVPNSTPRRQVNRTVNAPNTREGRRQADTELARLILEIDATPSPPKVPEATMTLDAFWEGHLSRHFSRWAPYTQSIDPGLWDHHVSPAVGSVAVRDLRRAHIAHLHQLLEAKGLALASVSKVHRLVRRVLEEAVELELIGANPAAGKWRNLRSPKPAVRPPSDAELDAVLAAAATVDAQFLVVLQLDAELPARRGELCALRWPDVDWEAGEITVARTLSRGPQGLVERHTKADERHRVAVDPSTLALLRSHRTRRLEDCMAAGVRMDEAGFVFVPARDPSGGKPLHPNRLSHLFRRASEKAGVSGVRLHDLRHYVASTLLANGVDVRTAAHRLGQHPNTTLAIYSHLIPAADRHAAGVLASKRRRVQGGES